MVAGAAGGMQTAAADGGVRRQLEPEEERDGGEHQNAQELTANAQMATAGHGEDGIDDGMRERPAAGEEEDGPILGLCGVPARVAA